MERAGAIFFLVLATVSGAGADGRLAIEGPDTVDVGAFEPGKCPSAVFRLRNAGDAPLRLSRVVAMCRCLELEESPESLTPGESGKLVARGRPEPGDDVFSGTVLIETDSRETPYAHVTVKRSMPWNRAALYRTPTVLSASPTNGIQTFVLEGNSFDGKTVRIPALLGYPEGEASGPPLPGIVLARDGGVDDCRTRIRFWNARGFAAIAADLACAGGNRARDEAWTHRAVEAVVRAHSLLRARPRIDEGRIGVEGSARGGYAVCLAAAVDERFAFAIVLDAGPFLDPVGGLPDRTPPWCSASCLQLVRMPFLWVDGATSPLDLLKDHYRRARTPQTLSIRCRNASGPWQTAGEREEPAVFARHAVRDGTSGFPAFGTALRKGRHVAASFSANGRRIAKAELVAAGASGKRRALRWCAHPAELRGNHVEATLPEGTSDYYLNLYTEEGLVASSAHETCTL